MILPPIDNEELRGNHGMDLGKTPPTLKSDFDGKKKIVE